MSAKWNQPAVLGCGTAVSAVVGAVAGTVLVTHLAFRFLAARLGPLYNGTGESGLAAILFVPAGAFWGGLAGPVSLWLAVHVNHWLRSGDLVGQQAGPGMLASFGSAVIGMTAFIGLAAGCAFALQFLVN